MLVVDRPRQHDHLGCAAWRQHEASAGGIVPCAVWEDDELMALRLRGDLAAPASSRCHTGGRHRGEPRDGRDVAGSHGDIIYVEPAARIRQLPVVEVEVLLTTREGGEERLVGSYTLVHGGLLNR